MFMIRCDRLFLALVNSSAEYIPSPTSPGSCDDSASCVVIDLLCIGLAVHRAKTMQRPSSEQILAIASFW